MAGRDPGIRHGDGVGEGRRVPRLRHEPLARSGPHRRGHQEHIATRRSEQRQQLLGQGRHVDIAAVHLVDHEKMPDETGGAQMCVPDGEGTEQGLIDRADGEARRSVALRLLRGPASGLSILRLGIAPLHAEVGQLSTFGLSHTVIARHREQRFGCAAAVRAVEPRLHTAVQLHRRRAQRHGEEAAVNQPGIDQSARPAQRRLGLARAGLAFQQHD
jgi:hypothetical protein